MPDLLIDPLPALDLDAMADEHEFAQLVEDGLVAEDFAPGFFEEEMGRLAARLAEDQGIPPALGGDLAEVVSPFTELAESPPDPLAEDLAVWSAVVDDRINLFDTYLATVPREPPPPDPIPRYDPELDALAGNLETVLAAPPPEEPAAPPPETVAPSGNIAVTAGNFVIWASTGATNARVYVSVDGSDLALFSEGVSGAQEAAWLSEGHAYYFALVDFSRGELGETLATTTKDLRAGAPEPPPAPTAIVVVGPGPAQPPQRKLFEPAKPKAPLTPPPPAPPPAPATDEEARRAARARIRDENIPFNPANSYIVRDGQVVQENIAFLYRDPYTGETAGGTIGGRVWNPETRRWVTTAPATTPEAPPQSAFLQEQLANTIAAAEGPGP